MQNFCLSEAILERFKKVEDELGYSEHIIKLNCDQLDTWEFRDRKVFEIGNIDELALSIKHGGQCQPIIVVRPSAVFKPKDNLTAQYVVIAGYRRWMACKKYGIDVLAVVRNMTFEQAITVLVSENKKETVSDYSKGLFYHTLLASKKVSPEQLSQQLNINLSLLNMYLSFAQVPEQIWTAVGDLSHVSAKTASIVSSLANQGSMYVNALLSIAKKIGQGYGEKRIQTAVDNYINRKLKRAPKDKMVNHKVKVNGKVIMTLSQGRLKLDQSLVDLGQYEELVEKIATQVTDFAHSYLGEKQKV